MLGEQTPAILIIRLILSHNLPTPDFQTNYSMNEPEKTGGPDQPEPRQERFRGDRKLLLELTQDEYDLMNWVRGQHQPARLYQWAKDVLLAAASETVRQANLTGKKVPQGVNEIVQRLKS